MMVEAQMSRLMICPTCGQPLPQARGRRICADCGKPMHRRDKWYIGSDGRLHHKNCTEPDAGVKAPETMELLEVK